MNHSNLSLVTAEPSSAADRTILNEEMFHRMVSLERKRTERSGNPFLLMLLDTGEVPHAGRDSKSLNKIVSALNVTTRETDVIGWYKDGSVVGVMFTEISIEDRTAILSIMMTRVSETLRHHLSFELFSRISISFHLFPEEWNQEGLQRPSNPMLYPDLTRRDDSKRALAAVKRMMDVAGSLAALIAFAPFFLVIAALVKLTSEGPVFFRQQRIGQHGVPFTFLKFRSMRNGNDASVHKEYVRKLIAGEADQKPVAGNGTGVYKLTNDKRITKVGAFLRRTSLDELPQFINVLCGEMSLVGPRPAIGYEVETYDVWHRRRILEAKPGITGLWQVEGRSRVKFDDMVRLDLRYANNWSPWMDVKILLRTPIAMFFTEGAV
ncbi:MAG TPA: sugar transferase [Terriglobales bacterium]|jgi:lipopolysaccharide/colanic/teichoic acid biosynthesis glycosyltransferase|nr:sugar transferase [Terriglobales bacterium]